MTTVGSSVWVVCTKCRHVALRAWNDVRASCRGPSFPEWDEDCAAPIKVLPDQAAAHAAFMLGGREAVRALV